MKKYLLTLIASFSLNVMAAETPHWSYEGKAGPQDWGELSDSYSYSVCKTGKFQSPIDIRDPIPAALPPLSLIFHTAAEKIVNNGHTLQVTVSDGDDFPLDNDTFKLMQYHFHSPSENLINGRQYPLEAHFVHANEKGDLAVVAVMFETGKENPALKSIIGNMPVTRDHSVSLGKKLNISELFPADRHYYRFSGSLTTPPCTEGLRWLVMKNSVTLSPEQLAKIQQALLHSNNRPVQSLNGRVIVD